MLVFQKRTMDDAIFKISQCISNVEINDLIEKHIKSFIIIGTDHKVCTCRAQWIIIHDHKGGMSLFFCRTGSFHFTT